MLSSSSRTVLLVSLFNCLKSLDKFTGMMHLPQSFSFLSPSKATQLVSTKTPNKIFPKIAPNRPATYWTPSADDLSFVGYNSVAVQPNELNVTTFMPPKIVASRLLSALIKLDSKTELSIRQLLLVLSVPFVGIKFFEHGDPPVRAILLYNSGSQIHKPI
ncbi:hypothetical protein BpHYR1_009477 [Brachionus plicatilis]|uniref:Uncharacterized protein n=1 Tax=Brachionus plicatilis TaxID=10195 RepID=A0A3M7RZX7_BRAPC|nr:hypothetical protein BpHYR1_009477 [Brachionus plicatilis]